MKSAYQTTLFLVVMYLVIVPHIDAQTLSVNTSAGISIPIQDFSKTYGPGFQGRIGSEYSLADNASVTLSSGYFRWPIKSGVGSSILQTIGAPGKLSIDGYVDNIPLEAGIRFYTTYDDYKVHLGFTSGMYFLHGQADLHYDPQNGTTVYSDRVSESWESSGFEVRSGIWYPVSDRWNFEFIVAYVNIFDWDHEIISPSSGIPGTAGAPPELRSISVSLGAIYTF